MPGELNEQQLQLLQQTRPGEGEEVRATDGRMRMKTHTHRHTFVAIHTIGSYLLRRRLGLGLGLLATVLESNILYRNTTRLNLAF